MGNYFLTLSFTELQLTTAAAAGERRQLFYQFPRHVAGRIEQMEYVAFAGGLHHLDGAFPS